MAKRTKRNAVTLVSLLLALGALIGGYYWYSNRSAADASEEEAETIALATLDTEQLSTLHYIYEDFDMTLNLKDGTWVSAEDPDRPINQDNVTSMIGVIDEINATRLIADNSDNLADYGLDQPASYLQATLTDNSTVTLQIGNMASGSSGYYALVNDDKKVYLLETSYGSGLQYTDADMTTIASAPELSADTITGISIDNRDSEDFELKQIENYGVDTSGSSLTTWFITKPYGEGFGANSDAVSTLEANYTAFDYISCVDYAAEDLSKYGLDNPMASITINYNEAHTETLDEPETDPSTGEEITEKTTYTPKEYKIFIGNQDEAGNYYIRQDASNAVYNIAADSIDKMLQVDTFSLISTYVCIPNIDNVDKIVAEAEGSEYTYEMKRSTVKNDAGEEETQTTYFYNGATVDEDAFKDLYQTMISASYDAEIKDEAAIKETDPYLTISYYLSDGKVVKGIFTPYDDSFCTAGTEGGPRFLIDTRVVDDIASAIKSFTGKAAE